IASLPFRVQPRSRLWEWESFKAICWCVCHIRLQAACVTLGPDLMNRRLKNRKLCEFLHDEANNHCAVNHIRWYEGERPCFTGFRLDQDTAKLRGSFQQLS